MMDLIVIAVAGVAVLVVLLASIVLLIRWRRNRYRFSIRALLLLFALIGAALFALMRLVTPIVAHRWAIQTIYDSGGDLLFREDYNADSSKIYSDRTKANPWGDVVILHVRNDREALTVASQLNRLPEAEILALGGVTDNGLAAICNNGTKSSLDTIELFESPVTAAGLSQLTSLKRLRTLFFNTCPIRDADLASLKSLDTLRVLTLLEEGKPSNPNRFTEAGFREVGQIKKLENLWLVNLKVSDAGARHLKNLTHLKKLQISRCQISDDAIAELRQALPQCEFTVYKSETAAPAGK